MRVLRGVRSTKTLLEIWFENRGKGTLASIILASVLLVIFSSIAVLHVETVPTGNIKDAEDAMWWSVSTITTVAYGDRVPVTTEGRLIGVLLMTAGVALFGVFTGYVSSWFSERKDETVQVGELKTEISVLAEEVRKLRLDLKSSAPS